MTDTGLERLRYGWRDYLRLTARHYLGLWLLYDGSHPARYQALNAFLAREKPLPFEASILPEAQGAQSAGLVATIARRLVAAAGIATALLALLGIAALLLPDAIPLPWRQASLLALGLHGYCLLVALTGVGIPRYLLGVWPLLPCSLGLAAAGFLQWWHERARR